MLALITATKNSIHTVKGALASAASIRSRIKHILIDADSSDGTLEFLKSFAAKIEHSVLLSQTGTGLYPALNQGVRAALADTAVTHIGFLHSDDRLIPGNFSEYISKIESSECDIFYSDIEYHNSDDRRVRVWIPRPLPKPYAPKSPDQNQNGRQSGFWPLPPASNPVDKRETRTAYLPTQKTTSLYP